jgi:glutamate-ammonia-ligase adenylyltransferase
LAARLAGVRDFSERVRVLNEFKDREMFRIDLRHITQRIDFRRFAEDLTALAEVVVGEAAVLCHDALREQAILLPNGQPPAGSICGLGKFGGREIGFGSDIELLFVYDDGAAQSRPAVARYYEEFVRLFMTTIKASQEGIFQIDLRLRPHGNAGAMAIGLGGLEQYYMEGGPAQQFERMALVKLRPVAGDPRLGERVQQTRDAFVYSGRPLDIEDIRHLRHRQATELVARGAVNAKYSPGGLVDVEYFVQARQIGAGHTDRSVRTTNTGDAIDRLTGAGAFDAAWAEELRQTYAFLRRLIDALRVVRGNAKDLTIPHSDSREFAYLTRRLGYGSPSALQDAITGHMHFARALWAFV